MTLAAFYTLSEPAGATLANDSSGNNAPALVMGGSGTDVVFGTTGLPTESQTAPTFSGGKYLRTNRPSFGTQPAIRLECFFKKPAAEVGGPLVDLGNVATIYIGSGIISCFLGGGGGIVVSSSPKGYDDNTWHHALFTAQDGGAANLYIDGDLVDTDAGPVSIPADNTPYTQVGFLGGTTTLAHVAYGFDFLSASTAAAHAEAGLTGFVGETPAERLGRYARYAGIDPAETDFETGRVRGLVHIDTTGMTALATMRLVETTEGGVLFDGLDGTLKFHDRAHRYGSTSAFTVSYSDGEVANPITPVDDDQQQVNEMTATNASGVTALVVDQDSKDEHGSYKDSVDLSTTDPDEPHHRASWVVGTRAEPGVRISEVEILLTTADDTLAAGVLSAEVGTMFTLTGLPSNAPASSMRLFVEGRSDRITADEDRVTLRCSPAELWDVFILDDPVYGQLDAGNRIAY